METSIHSTELSWYSSFDHDHNCITSYVCPNKNIVRVAPYCTSTVYSFPYVFPTNPSSRFPRHPLIPCPDRHPNCLLERYTPVSVLSLVKLTQGVQPPHPQPSAQAHFWGPPHPQRQIWLTGSWIDPYIVFVTKFCLRRKRKVNLCRRRYVRICVRIYVCRFLEIRIVFEGRKGGFYRLPVRQIIITPVYRIA
jgi:hypothetical protein